MWRWRVSVRLERLVTGPLEVNTYVLEAGGDCLVVDPGCCSLDEVLEGMGCRRVVVAVTHGHFDHSAGVDCVKERWGALLAAHPLEPMIASASAEVGRAWGFSVEPQRSSVDLELDEGSRLSVGPLSFQVYHMPGHSPDHIILYSPEASLAFTGDLIFAGSIGRVDLPGSDPNAMRESLRRLVATLNPGARILPGHGPETTLARELEYNPFLRSPELIFDA